MSPGKLKKGLDDILKHYQKLFPPLNYTKLIAWLSMFLMLAGLLPVIILGRYNHPTGDDYYYGVETHHLWEESHRLLPMLGEAAKGVRQQYQIWQGTYSAMFLMYLPPNAFSESAYHLTTFFILLLLTAGIFYLSRQLLCGLLNCGTPEWLAISAVISMLCVQTTLFQPESFFWYNGSIYYTGFFAVSLIYFGILIKAVQSPHVVRLILLCLLGLFLAGGNYVSFLPTMLLTFSVIGLLFLMKKIRSALLLCIPGLALIIGFLISALAPGNSVRQDGLWKISAKLAIYKSLRQGISFLTGWTSLWFVIALLILTPVLWLIYERCSFRFRFPVLVIGYSYGLLCSTTCPTYYTMNSTGPARAVAIMYYSFVLFIVISYVYLLGYFHRLLREKSLLSRIPYRKLFPVLPVLLITFLVIQGCTGAFSSLTAVRAYKCLASGEAAAYEAEHQKRMLILNDPSLPDVILQPYQIHADLLYVGDFTGDAEHPTNQRIAAYFHKSSLRVNWD